MTAILYYITAHGYGHAVRSFQVIRTLKQRCPDAIVYVRSIVPEWLLNDSEQRVVYSRQALDVGIVQRDSLDMGLGETLVACQSLHQRRSILIQEELAFIEKHGIAVIVGDIPPLCFEIAARCGIPSVAIGNFSWSRIYRDYVSDYPQFLPLIESMEDSYRQATLALSLPYSCGMEVFPRSGVIPLVTRRSSLDKDEARKKFDLPMSATIVLLSFGGLGLARFSPEKLLQQRDFFFVGTSDKPRREKNILFLPQAQREYVDLVRACDAVISKPGYGISADIIAHRVPLLYTARGQFAEYPFLVRLLHAWATAAFISQEELIEGNLSPALQKLLEQSPNWPSVATDGAEISADRILNLIV